MDRLVGSGHFFQDGTRAYNAKATLEYLDANVSE